MLILGIAMFSLPKIAYITSEPAWSMLSFFGVYLMHFAGLLTLDFKSNQICRLKQHNIFIKIKKRHKKNIVYPKYLL